MVAKEYQIPIAKDTGIPHCVYIAEYHFEAFAWANANASTIAPFDLCKLLAEGEHWQVLAARWQLGEELPHEQIDELLKCPACGGPAHIVELTEVTYRLQYAFGRLEIDESSAQTDTGCRGDLLFACEKCRTRWDIPDEIELYSSNDKAIEGP